jgi:protein phosphatase-4 regulatory subunit 3
VKGSAIENVPALLRNNRFRRDPRQLDEDEEMWFNDEDEIEDGDGVVPASSSPEMIGRKIDADLDSLGKLLDKKADSIAAGRNLGNPLSPRSSPLTTNNAASTSPTMSNSSPTDGKTGVGKKIGLVDYDGDSDEEEPDDTEDGLSPEDKPAKRPRLT